MNTPIFWTGRHLQAARKLAGLTQRTLADLAGTHVNSVKYWEGQDGALSGAAVGKFQDVLADNGIAAYVDQDGAGGGLIAMLEA